MKTCKKCGRELPLETFGKRSRNPDGLQDHCKPCTNAGIRAYRAGVRREPLGKEVLRRRNVIRMREYNKRLEVRARNAAWGRQQVLSGKHAQRAREQLDRYRARTDEEILADRVRLRPDGIKACRRCGEFKGVDEFWAKRAAPDGLGAECKECGSRRIVREARAYWVAQGIPLVCAYCSGPFEHVDHVVPTSRGGADEAWNTLPSCAACNLSKGALPLDIWLPRRRRELESRAA